MRLALDNGKILHLVIKSTNFCTPEACYITKNIWYGEKRYVFQI